MIQRNPTAAGAFCLFFSDETWDTYCPRLYWVAALRRIHQVQACLGAVSHFFLRENDLDSFDFFSRRLKALALFAFQPIVCFFVTNELFFL